MSLLGDICTDIACTCFCNKLMEDPKDDRVQKQDPSGKKVEPEQSCYTITLVMRIISIICIIFYAVIFGIVTSTLTGDKVKMNTILLALIIALGISFVLAWTPFMTICTTQPIWLIFFMINLVKIS